MIVEAGISFGATSVLPSVSAVKMSKAPLNAENGISTRWSEPTSLLEIWGMSKPTKAITPATAAVTAANTPP